MMDCEYAQYDYNNKLSFTLQSMAYEDYGYVVVMQRLPDGGLPFLAQGSDMDILQAYGDMPVESSCITRDGFLRVILS